MAASPMSNSLPPPLMTSEEGSFAQRTVLRRKPQIARDVLRDNHYPPEIQAAVEGLITEIESLSPVHPLHEAAPDVEYWDEQWRPYAGRHWLALPWYFAEAFFYRRLLEAVRYFQPGPWEGHDPFAMAKRRAIEGPHGALLLATHALLELPAELPAALLALLHDSLWGNRADLSNREVVARLAGHGAEQQDLLLDDSAQVVDFLLKGAHRRIDFINDNAGPEAAFDLLLAGFLLDRSLTGAVRMHLKPYPFYVSDALIPDMRELISRLEGAPEPRLRAAGERLEGHLQSGRLELTTDRFWASAYEFRDMPADLRRDLARADLVIIKGDANYRRLLGDRHWPYTTRLAEIVAYFPAPLAVLRTLKAEIIVGLEPGQAEQLAAADANWLVNGKRGLIQFVGRM